MGRLLIPTSGLCSSKQRGLVFMCRMHGQHTGAFSWSPVLRPTQEDRLIPTRLYPELRTWMAVYGVISVSPCAREVQRHLPTCNPGFVPHAYHSPPPLTRLPYTYSSSASEIIVRRLCQLNGNNINNNTSSTTLVIFQKRWYSTLLI